MDEEIYRIIDETGTEIHNPDLNLGYLKKDSILITDLPEAWHYEVDHFTFEDGYKYYPVSNDDPHIEVISLTAPIFKYVDIEHNNKVISGTLIKKVIDQEAIKEYETILRYIRYTQEELIMRGLPARVTTTEENIQNLNSDLVDFSDSVNTDLSDLIEITAELSGSDVEDRVTDIESQIVDVNTRIDGTESQINDTELTVEDILLFIADLAGGAEETEEEEKLVEDPTEEEPIDNEDPIEE